MPLLSDPVHFSNLRHMARSPAHYVASVLEPRASTAAMAFGSIVHAVLFQQPYSVWRGGARRGAKWEDFEHLCNTEKPGAPVLTEAEYDRAMRCCDAIGAHRDATRVLVGQQEVTVNRRVLGRECQGRIDVLGVGYVSELKTTSNAHPSTFIRGALRLGYHAQLPWYQELVGKPDWQAFIVAVETAAPFAVTVFELTPRCLEEGRKLWRIWLEQLLVCESSQEYPAYAQCVVPFDVPEYDAPLIIDGEEVEAA